MAAALAVAAAGLVAAPTAANAVVTDELAVTNAEFSWAVNHESTGGAYFGACNFLAAGEAGNTGSARVWTDADGFYKTSDGNVTVVKPDAEGTYAQAAWADKCKNRLGTSVAAKTSGLTFTTGGVTQPSYTEAEVRIAGGTGTVNPVTDSGTISWDGSFTLAYYGGMTYWTITDPVLTLENGHGSITGTFSGYGADMDNPEVWTTLTPVTATLADFTTATVDVTDTGFEVTPDYLGVDTTADGRNPQAELTTDNQSWWGAFPTSWIEFNLATGQDSYWYTTAGTATSIQPRKVAAPVAVAYTGTPIETEEPVDPVLENTALPTTYGTAKVGKDVIARTGSWSESPDRVSYRWLRDGKAISGATKSRYTVTATDAGKKLQVEVTAAKDGFPTTAATSAKTATVAKGTFTAKTPTISGTKKVGKTLKVSVGSWSPKATKYSYRWYANGKAISGGAKASLKLAKSQQGKRITVKVTGTKTGYTTVSKTSSKTGKVAKR